LKSVEMTKDWLPTSENINALPAGIKKYIHDLETLCDPAGIVQENILLKDAMRALELKILEQREEQMKQEINNEPMSAIESLEYENKGLKEQIEGLENSLMVRTLERDTARNCCERLMVLEKEVIRLAKTCAIYIEEKD